MAGNDQMDQDAIAAQWEASLDSEDPAEAEKAAAAKARYAEILSAVNAAQSRALKGAIIDPAELTKLREATGNAEVAISRQLEILVAKENARSPQEDSAPQGYTKPVAEYFKGLANQSGVAQKP